MRVQPDVRRVRRYRDRLGSANVPATLWLGRQDSNLGMAESKSYGLAFLGM